MTVTIGALFAGYGGLEMGASVAFGDPAVSSVSEIDRAASLVLAERCGVPNIGDVTAVNWSMIPRVDVLTGGFPCQDVSLAGKRAGMTATNRSGLWARMADAVEALTPPLVIIENVRGILSAPAHSDVEPCPWCLGDTGGEPALRALGAVLGDLSDLGYDASWTLVRASDVGAPHPRARVFVVAWPADTDSTGLEEPEPAGRRHMPAGRVAGDPSDIVGERGWEVGRLRTWAPWPPGGPGRGAAEDTHGEPRSERRPAAPGQAEGGWARPDPGGRGGAPAPDTGGISGEGPRAAEAWGPEPADVVPWGPYAPAVHRWEQATGRPAPAPTQVSTKGTPVLSARFVEWMMGLPDGHVTHLVGRRDALRLLGNGVVPQQAAYAIRALLPARLR